MFVAAVAIAPGSAQTLRPESPEASAAARPAPDDGAAFRSLFTEAAADFRRLVSTESAVILSIGGIAAAAGHSGDRPLSATMSGMGALRTAFRAGEPIGGARLQAAGAIATYAIGRIASNPTLARVGGDLIRAQIVSQTMTMAIKTAVGRTRPDGTQYSFPSGHSSVAFASATVLQRHFGWKAGVPAYAMAGYVAASRIQVRRHFLSDVTFGAALGIVAGRTVTIGRGDRRFALAPVVVPGGAGASLVWVGRR